MRPHKHHTVSMVQVYVNIENSLELLQQLKNGQNNIIAIAEPRGLIPEGRRGVGGWIHSRLSSFYSQFFVIGWLLSLVVSNSASGTHLRVEAWRRG